MCVLFGTACISDHAFGFIDCMYISGLGKGRLGLGIDWKDIPPASLDK